MALIITHAHEAIQIEQLIVALYGGPGLGKTTTAFTADRPLLLDFDGGSYRAKNRGDVVRVGKWADVAQIESSDVAGYGTLIADTAGRLLDALSVAVMASDAKNRTRAGNLTLQGFGELKSAFAQWLNKVKSFGLDVVLIAHASEERKGDELIERLDVQGGSRGEIHKSADAMGRLVIQNGERLLTFSPTDAAFGKNPGQLPALTVPSPDRDPRFLADVIARIKASINAQSEAQTAMRARLDDETVRLTEFTTADEFTKRAGELADAAPPVKMLVLQVAKNKGFVFDKDAKAFVAAPETVTDIKGRRRSA
jgi:hypothetical protein